MSEMEELFAVLCSITERYIDIRRDGGTVIDAIADVLEDFSIGYVVITMEAYDAFVAGLVHGNKAESRMPEY